MKRRVILGRPVASVFCAAEGSRGEALLEAIREGRSGSFHRKFSDWNADGIATGFVRCGDRDVPLDLHLNGNQGVVLVDVNYTRRISMKARRVKFDTFVLEVGRGVHVENRRRIDELAAQIVATFIAHGEGWMDRKGHYFELPYGSKSSVIEIACPPKGEWRLPQDPHPLGYGHGF